MTLLVASNKLWLEYRSLKMPFENKGYPYLCSLCYVLKNVHCAMTERVWGIYMSCIILHFYAAWVTQPLCAIIFYNTCVLQCKGSSSFSSLYIFTLYTCIMVFPANIYRRNSVLVMTKLVALECLCAKWTSKQVDSESCISRCVRHLRFVCDEVCSW